MSTTTDHDAEKSGNISGAVNEEGHVSEKILQHSHDADEALMAFQTRQGEIVELDEETNRRLLRKIDWHLMPVCCPRVENMMG